MNADDVVRAMGRAFLWIMFALALASFVLGLLFGWAAAV